MNLESVIQNEVSQKEKKKQKMVLINLFTGQEERHGHIENSLQTQQGKKRVRQTDRAALRHIHHHM